MLPGSIAAALAAAALLVPASAPARASHHGRDARKHAATQRCTLTRHHAPGKAGHGAHSRARAVASCPSVVGSHRRPHGAPTAGGLEATPLGGGSGAPPEAGGGAGGTPSGTHGSGTGAGGGSLKGGLPVENGETINDPIDPRFLTDMPFGTKSFWIQPWRAYLDTWPAGRLQQALGINFNVRPENAEATAQLLQDAGFKLARINITWAALSYDDPTQFAADHINGIVERLTALHKHGLRPLIILQAYSGAPTPMKLVTLETTAPAPAGARTVTLAPASAALVVPGKTGFNELTFPGDPDVLITSVGSGGVATLSRPLVNALPAGAHGGSTLLYAPFQSPKLPNGQPNPQFQATMAGWLNYVGTVSKEAASIVGPGGFDLEIWNELSFGSAFLNADNYYQPEEGAAPAAQGGSGGNLAADGGTREGNTAAQEGSTAAGEGSAATGAVRAEDEASGEPSPGSEPEEDGPDVNAASEPGLAPESEETPEVEDGPEAEGAQAEELGPEMEPVGTFGAAARGGKRNLPKHQISVEVRQALVRETVAYMRNPANGFSPEVGITDGFASETPFPSGAGAPVGLTALSKHPYAPGGRIFPEKYRLNDIYPLNAIGQRDTPAKGSFAPLFVPHYESTLPEYFLTGTSTETLIRDVAPFTTDIYHFPHGREVGPAGGSPVQKWVTEYNMIPGKSTVLGPDEVTPQTGPSATLSPADKRHFDAKVVLRSLVSMVSKGFTRDYFFAAGGGAFSLIEGSFFSELEAHPGTFPGDSFGGETLEGLHELLRHAEGPGPGGDSRQLKLLSITQDGDHAQFTGDGSDAHPDLFDRDVLAVFPFQASPTHFVIPVYVMTRDLLTLYEPSASPADITRFDLPEETFKITLGGLPAGGAQPLVSAFDPLRKSSTPARLVSQEGETATFEFAATDYPRMLSIEYPA